MKRISQGFNLNNKRSVKNLHQVLRYLSPEVKFSDERVVDEETEKAIEELLQPGEPVVKDGRLSRAAIGEINAALVTKKYEEPENIARLHRNFGTLRKKKFIKLDIADEEIKRKEIGDSTRAFITAFQKKYNLPSTGRLDPDTDEKMESVITSIAGSKPQPKKRLKSRNVAELTRVVRSLHLNKSGERVQHLQKGLAWLGHTIHEEEFRARTYGVTTKNAVKQLQSSHGLPLTGRVDKDTARAINLELGRANPKILTCEKIRVRGSVRDELWQGKGGVTVRVYQKGLGGRETLLGERRTFRNGFYDVFFTPPQDPSKTPLHLTVKIFDGGQELDSKTYYNVKKVLWVNFTEGKDRYRGISEFERLLKTLSPILEAAGLKIEDVEQSEARQDVLFLYRQTGVLPETIMKLSLAHRIANKVNRADLPPAAFYGFLRQNLPPELPADLFPDEPGEWHPWVSRVVDRVTDGLVFLEGDIQQDALDNAIAQNYIPRPLKA